MKLLLLSDTHGELDKTKAILRKEADADVRFHLGDVGFEPDKLPNVHIVRGNHDHCKELSMESVVSLEDRRILCLHGHRFDQEIVQEVLANKELSSEDMMDACRKLLCEKLAYYAKCKGCDTVFFGHLHMRIHCEVGGIVLVNPGSVWFGMDHAGYAVVQLCGKDLQVVFHDIEETGETPPFFHEDVLSWTKK